MADSPRLRIPSHHVQAFQALAELDDPDAVALLGLLSQDDPPIIGEAELERLIVEVVPNLEEDAGDLIDALSALFVLRFSHGWAVDEVATSISQGENLRLEEPERSRLEGRLRLALDAPTLAVNAKAVDLASAHERVFHIARIVTDVRPVYAQDVTGPPSAAVISHVLEIGYFSSRAGVESFFVGMSTEALSTLASQVARAEEKAASLRQFLEASGLRVLEPSTEGG